MQIIDFPKIPKESNTVVLTLIYIDQYGRQSGRTVALKIACPWENPDKDILDLHNKMTKIIHQNCA